MPYSTQLPVPQSYFSTKIGENPCAEKCSYRQYGCRKLLEWEVILLTPPEVQEVTCMK